MRAPCIDAAAVLAALAERDPETLIGPILCLMTWLAGAASARDTEADAECHRLGACLAAHFGALAAHPSVSLELRLAAGALAIEHRRGAT